MVMRELKKLDKVAYIRFASVYRSFEDIDDFRALVDDSHISLHQKYFLPLIGLFGGPVDSVKRGECRVPTVRA